MKETYSFFEIIPIHSFKPFHVYHTPFRTSRQRFCSAASSWRKSVAPLIFPSAYHLLCLLLCRDVVIAHPASQHLLKKPVSLRSEIEECRKESRYYTLPNCADHPEGRRDETTVATTVTELKKETEKKKERKEERGTIKKEDERMEETEKNSQFVHACLIFALLPKGF